MMQMKKTIAASIVLLILIFSGAIYIFMNTGETLVSVRTKNFDQPMPKLAVSIALGDVKAIEGIRKEYQNAIAPRIEQLAQIDLRLKQIDEALSSMDTKKVEFEETLIQTSEEYEDKARQAWDNSSKELEAEYESQRGEYLKKIEDHAASLQLNFLKPENVPSVDAYLSAFRLGLYNVSTNVNAELERKWSEETYAQWQEYEASWQKRMDQAMIKGRVIDDKKRLEINKLKVEAPVVDNKREPLLQQRARLQMERDDTRQFLYYAADPYLVRIISLYRATAVKTQMTDLKGEAVFGNIELTPGSYFILAELTDESGTRVWRKQFLLRENRNNEMIIQPDEARTLRQILEE